MEHDLEVSGPRCGIDLPIKLRHSMQRKLVLWTVAIVAISTFVCAMWLTRIARQAMTDSHARGVAILNQTVAAALAGRLAYGWNPAAHRVLGVLPLDSRVAFIMITDAKGIPVHRRVIDPEAWAAYSRRVAHGGPNSVIEVGRAFTLGRRGDLMAHKTPIWNPPIRTHVSNGTLRDRSLEGFIVLAVREPGLPQTLAELRAMQLMAALVTCLLSVPVVIWMVRRWTAPIRALLDATTRLSLGGCPSAVSIRTHDEMGLLAASFNHMAKKLSVASLKLQDANRQLEQKVQDRTAQLEEAVQKLEEMVAIDPLTGLSNRRSLGQALARCFARAQRYGNDLACVMIDVDRFKLINDSLGHQAGDELLQEAARILGRQCRQSDVAGRFGGDEFIILLPQTDAATACQVAHRISDEFMTCAKRLFGHWEMVEKIGLSAGVATLAGSDYIKPDQLVAHADQALYLAKQTGRAKVVLYNSDCMIRPDPVPR